MSNQIILKKSSVGAKVPVAGDLTYGELALNYADGKLYFKNASNQIQSFTNDSTTVTLAGTQTLSNKTLAGATLTGALIASGTAGTNGQVLVTTGSGVQWVTRNNATLSALTDVSISSPVAQQVLKFNGTQWINAANDQAVASAIFATSQADLGSVTDNVLAFSEDLGFVNDIAYFIYDMGQLRLDGIVSLSNLDQSVKADYTAIAIIFGF
jgi:hypothetical protein